MMTCKKWPHWIGSSILCLSLLAGCSSSQPTRFYTLSSLAAQGTPIERRTTWIGIGPISFPGYLDRPHVVTRNDANLLTVAEFEQWAEPLEPAFQRVLIENLSIRLGTDQVIAAPPRRDVAMAHQVEIDIARFDADDTGKVVLDARWRIFDGRGDLMEGSGRSFITRQVTAPRDYRSIAEAMSDCLGAMSEEISQSLVALRTS